MDNIEAIRHNWREDIGTRIWHSIRSVRVEGGQTVVSRLTGAIVRMILVMVLVAAPSALLVSVTADTVVRLVPPLILTVAEADEMVAILAPLVKQFLLE